MNFRMSALYAALAGLAACSQSEQPTETVEARTTASGDPAAYTQPLADQSAALNAWFENQWEAELARSPQFQTYLGRKSNYNKLDNASDAFAVESHNLRVNALAEMREKFSIDRLSPEAQLSLRLFEYSVASEIDAFHFRNHWYEFSQFRGPHSSVPAFFINQHRVDTTEDARAYIERLRSVNDQMGQYQQIAEGQFANGVHPPKWSYEKMIVTASNLITGAPFDDGGNDSTIRADYAKKFAALNLDAETQSRLIADADAAMTASVLPAYEALIDMFTKQMASAGDDDGAWKLPNGDQYYASQLKTMTTTEMSAVEIHALGLKEVKRIHEEMSVIKEKVGFDGSLQDFFVYMRTDPDGKFTYANTDAGRAEYLEQAASIIEIMRGRLDELFLTKPRAELIVKRVEPFREKAAGKAFYQRPALDGSRPGTYYANLYDMANMPIYQMEALAYHEGVPGHHMQRALSQEVEGLPSFRVYSSSTAYTEGWGLYSELIPKEMGFYEDPYSDFGRLAMELWRAARLVVDTGIHDKRWTRQEAVDYLLTNTPNPEGDCRSAIDRYIVMPGQATAYKIGMLKILELRAHAKEQLGDQFNIRAFHDVVLANGPVPLSVLEENIDRWIQNVKAS